MRRLLTHWIATVLAGSLPAVAAPSPAKPGVVLLHGIHDSGEKMAWLARRLQSAGYETFCPSLQPADGSVSLATSAASLDALVARRFGKDRPLHVVGFSMGGLITRHWLASYPVRQRVLGFATISSPHRGTWFAYVNNLPGVREMRPNSPFLTQLQSQDRHLAGLRPLSVYTPFDLIILPASSSVWKCGQTKLFWSVAHPLMVFNPRVAKSVLTYFDEAEKAAAR